MSETITGGNPKALIIARFEETRSSRDGSIFMWEVFTTEEEADAWGAERMEMVNRINSTPGFMAICHGYFSKLSPEEVGQMSISDLGGMNVTTFVTVIDAVRIAAK